MALKFPLEDTDKYKARIRFTVQKSIPPKVNKTSASVSKQQAQKSVDNLIDKGLTFLKDFAVDVIPEALTTQYSGSSFQTQSGNYAELYMPQGVQITDGVIFDNKEIGIRGAAALNSAASEGISALGMAGRLMNPLGDINSITEAMKATGGEALSRTLAAGIGSKVGDITGAVTSSAVQATINPNTRSVFQGVPIREFQFAFKLIPSSAAENKAIGNIVKFFRRQLYPKQIASGNLPLGFEFPDRFLIHSIYNGKRIDPFFLPCYLKTINTTFNAQSQSFYRDGQYSEIDLALTFTEVRAMTKQDVENGISSTGQTNPYPNMSDGYTSSSGTGVG